MKGSGERVPLLYLYLFVVVYADSHALTRWAIRCMDMQSKSICKIVRDMESDSNFIRMSHVSQGLKSHSKSITTGMSKHSRRERRTCCRHEHKKGLKMQKEDIHGGI
jgi:hypothetical protein